MRMHLVKAVTAPLTATEYDTATFGGNPFTVGNDCVLVVAKDGDFAGDNITIRTNNYTDNAGVEQWTTVRTAADGDAATTQINEYYNITLGDSIEITAAGVSAGGFSVYLLGDS